MQNAELDENEMIIEFLMDRQGNKIKKLRPIFIKSEPDREHTLHMDSKKISDVPEENLFMVREETISSDEKPSNLVTILTDSDSSKAAGFEDATVGLELDLKKTALCQIATGLKTASDGYLELALCIPHLAPYDLPQVITQSPPPPMDVPMPIRKALSVDGESKTVSHLMHCEYGLTNTSWSQVTRKIPS